MVPRKVERRPLGAEQRVHARPRGHACGMVGESNRQRSRSRGPASRACSASAGRARSGPRS
eukprot:9830548-Lingulodinium_polyedra.AAC.1